MLMGFDTCILDTLEQSDNLWDLIYLRFDTFQHSLKKFDTVGKITCYILSIIKKKNWQWKIMFLTLFLMNNFIKLKYHLLTSWHIFINCCIPLLIQVKRFMTSLVSRSKGLWPYWDQGQKAYDLTGAKIKRLLTILRPKRAKRLRHYRCLCQKVTDLVDSKGQKVIDHGAV